LLSPTHAELFGMKKNAKIAVIASLFLLVWLVTEMFLDLTGLWRLPALLRWLRAAHLGKVVLL